MVRYKFIEVPQITNTVYVVYSKPQKPVMHTISICTGLVLVGVKGNSARLGTNVNILLGWICTVGILQGTLGLLAKCLIFGKFYNLHKSPLIMCK